MLSAILWDLGLPGLASAAAAGAVSCGVFIRLHRCLQWSCMWLLEVMVVCVRQGKAMECASGSRSTWQAAVRVTVFKLVPAFAAGSRVASTETTAGSSWLELNPHHVKKHNPNGNLRSKQLPCYLGLHCGTEPD